MTEYPVDIQLTLTLLSPLHVGTGHGYAGLLDAVMTTDRKGYPYVPGSSLKGRLRHYLRQLTGALAAGREPAALETALFGSEKQSGTLVFNNLALTDDWRRLIEEALGDTTALGLARTQTPMLSQRQTNVMLSRLRGVALERRLFTVENAPAHLAFSGSIQGTMEDQHLVGRYPLAICMLVAAIRACSHLGGRKSRGLGRCHLEIDSLQVDGVPVEADSLLEALA